MPDENWHAKKKKGLKKTNLVHISMCVQLFDEVSLVLSEGDLQGHLHRLSVYRVTKNRNVSQHIKD